MLSALGRWHIDGNANRLHCQTNQTKQRDSPNVGNRVRQHHTFRPSRFSHLVGRQEQVSAALGITLTQGRHRAHHRRPAKCELRKAMQQQHGPWRRRRRASCVSRLLAGDAQREPPPGQRHQLLREPAHAAPRRRHGGGGCRCNASDAHHQWDKRRQRRQERRGRRGSARPLHVLAGLRRRSPPWGVQAAAGRSPSRQRTARPIVAQGGQSGTKRACICARHGARLQAPVNTHTDELGRVHALAAGHTFQGLKSHIGSVQRC